VSYGVYRLHFIVLHQLERVDVRFADLGNGPLTLVSRTMIVLVLSMALATISFVVLERPATRFLRTWLRKSFPSGTAVLG
jgi:peptidoglycan/LPS O-acetylase OafA/YrhL